MAKKINSATEKKIKQAAKEVFLKKGLSGSRTREITDKAGVNLALLNYYFGGKDELYKVVMFEMLEDFQNTMSKILDNAETSFEEKMKTFTDSYYDAVVSNPKVFPFIIDILRQDIETINKSVNFGRKNFSHSNFAKQYIEITGKSMDDFKDFFINFLGLLAFPVIGAPLFTAYFDFKEDQYFEFLMRRKKFIFNIIPHLY